MNTDPFLRDLPPHPEDTPARRKLRAECEQWRKSYNVAVANGHSISARAHRSEHDAALSQGAAHEERGLDVNTVRVSTEALIVVFRRFCLGRYGEAPTEQEFRNMLGRASRLATPEATPEDRCPMCGYRHEASADHRWDAKEQQYVATPEAAPEEPTRAVYLQDEVGGRAYKSVHRATPTPTTEEPG